MCCLPLAARWQRRRSVVALGLDRAYGVAQLRDDGLLIRPHEVTIAKSANATSVRELLVEQQTRTLVAQAGENAPYAASARVSMWVGVTRNTPALAMS